MFKFKTISYFCLTIFTNITLELTRRAETQRKPGRLSSLEAVAAALSILGESEHAAHVAAVANWGTTFLQLNAEPLEEYSGAVDSSEVVRIQSAYLEAAGAMAGHHGDLPSDD